MQSVSLRDYCQQARSLIPSGEPHKAILFTRHILRRYPRHVDSYRVLAHALLAAGDLREATRQYRRVLSADPEDISARIGLAEIHQATGDLDKAVWHAQRALELSPGDTQLRARLGQLADERQGNGRPGAFEITRAALGRIHARAGLHAKAIQEFRAVLEQNPDRADVQTALAEVLWRTGDHLEAAEICQRILEKLPNALKANLMLGALWSANQEPDEARPYLETAQALDPENLVAQTLFGEASPLPSQEVYIEPLGEDELASVQHWPPPTAPEEHVSLPEEQEPALDWMSLSHEEESTPMSDEERADEEFELPDWLKGVGDDLLGESDEQPVAASPDEPAAEKADETPAWLRDLVTRAEEESGTPGESVPAEPDDVPQWLRELRPEVPEETPSEPETPDWLASIVEDQPPDDLQIEPVPGPVGPEEPDLSPMIAELPGEDEGQPLLEESLAEEWPPEEEWLRTTADLGEMPGELEEPEPVAGQPPLHELEVPEAEVDEAGLPDWLRDIKEGEIRPEPEAEATPQELEPSLLEPLGDTVEDTDVPDWLREITAGEPVPSGEAEPVVAEPVEAEPIVDAPQPVTEVEVDDDGLPDWLRAFGEPIAEEGVPQAQPEALELPDEPGATADEGRALWERILAEEGLDLASADEAPPPEAAGMTAEEWLRSTADLEETPSAPQEPQPVAEEPSPREPEPVAEADDVGPLDWLEDAEEPVVEEIPPAVEVESPQAEVPDWLSRVTAGEPVTSEEVEPITPQVEAEPVSDLPDWMRELGEAAAAVEEEPEEVVEVEIDEAGLADWSQEPVAEEAEFLEPTAVAPAETPEWLAELESEEMLLAESDLDESLELETGEMPEWLGEVMAGESPLAEEWEPELEGAELQEEQIPDWLREFRKLGERAGAETPGEPVELEAPAEARLEEEYAEPPELPDWLLHLRQGVADVETLPPSDELPEVEELPPPVPFEAEAELVGEVEVLPEFAEELVAAEEPVAAEEVLPELELAQEEETLAAEVVPAPEEALEVSEPEPEPVEFPVPELLVTRELEPLAVENLPEDPGARLSMARAALDTGDWSDALMIYETLVSSSEMLDSVIDNLETGLRSHPNDPAGYQLLGDACMKDGRLGAALAAYRNALSKL